MSARSTRVAGLGALLLAVAVLLPFLTTFRSNRSFFTFEATLSTDRGGITQLFWDNGAGFQEADSTVRDLNVEGRTILFRYPLPGGTIKALRFDPNVHGAHMTISGACIRDSARAVVYRFAPEDFVPAKQIASIQVRGDQIDLTVKEGDTDPNLLVRIPGPLKLRYRWADYFRGLVLPFGLAAAVAWAAMTLAGRLARAPSLVRLAAALADRPLTAITLAALVGVVWQCHPMVFCGRSLVSPNNGVFLLYPTFPTLPGYSEKLVGNTRGADINALMYQHVNYSVLQRDALRNGEWPLWNRYDLGGTPLLGQGQSMFGDPLNWLTIATGSAAWAWDLRFLVSRWLFASGLGIAIWLLTRSLPIAGFGAVVSPFIGFFAFRFNHPAILSLGYAPWVLVAWLALAETRTRLTTLLALAGLVLVHFSMLNSGTAKEAAMLTACADLAGVLALLALPKPWAFRRNRLAAAAAALGVFILISAPWWLTFLETLRHASNSYEEPRAFQISAAQFLSFFEDLFDRQSQPHEEFLNPSTGVPALIGLVWLVAAPVRLWRHRVGRALFLGALVPFAFAFGIVPAAWIIRVPFLANIEHIGNTFSCALIVPATVLAGLGWQWLWEDIREAGARTWLRKLGVSVLLVGGLVAAWLAASRGIRCGAFLRGYSWELALAALATLWIVRELWRHEARAKACAMLACGAFLLVWRHGQYVSVPFPNYVVLPKLRVDLQAESPAVAAARRHVAVEPGRAAGVGYTMFLGYHAMVRLESIYGVDAMRPPWFDELATALGDRKVKNWDYYTDDTASLAALAPLHDLTNVRVYLAPAGTNVPGTRIASLDLDVFDRPTAWPRAFFADRIVSCADLPAFVARLRAAQGHPFAAIMADDAAAAGLLFARQDDSTPAHVVAAHDYRLDTNSTAFTVEATGPGIIVLTESYYPGLDHVTVNGEPAEPVRVNYAFRGVRVGQAGTYRVEFRHEPPLFRAALRLAALGLAVGGLLAGWFWRSAHRGLLEPS